MPILARHTCNNRRVRTVSRDLGFAYVRPLSLDNANCVLPDLDDDLA